MARHINVRHKNFLFELRAKMKERYIPNQALHDVKPAKPAKPTEPAEPITPMVPKTVEPVNATVPEKVSVQQTQDTTLADFEKEYQEFIIKLKAKKEANEKAAKEADVIKEAEKQKEEIKQEVEVVEEKPKRKRKTTEKKDESTSKKERTRKTKTKKEKENIGE